MAKPDSLLEVSVQAKSMPVVDIAAAVRLEGALGTLTIETLSKVAVFSAELLWAVTGSPT